MDLLAHIAQPACEHEFYLGVYILHSLFDGELSFQYLFTYGTQFVKQCFQFVGGEQSDALQHGDMCHAAHHVAFGQIEIHLTVSSHGEPFYFLGCAEALVPQFWHISPFLVLKVINRG